VSWIITRHLKSLPSIEAPIVVPWYVIQEEDGNRKGIVSAIRGGAVCVLFTKTGRST